MTDSRGVYIVLLNWNGWQDTIACLDSLLPDMHRGARIVVCDNASSDSSLAHIQSWACGREFARPASHPRLAALQNHGLAKPRHQRLSWATAERGDASPDAQLLLIDNGDNLGFAAGNNVGLRFALSQPDMTAVWLLNNDTLVEPGCLPAMLDRLAKHDQPAVCGSVIHFFDHPETIQCIGGNRFDCRSGRAMKSEGRFISEDALPAIRDVEQRIDYLSGCSMLLPREFLATVGLMNEAYFLYYEEIDWFTRAAGRFDLLIAGDARLYHREGSSIGSRSWRRGPSPLSDRHMFRSRLTFMRRHYPEALRTCMAGSWLDVGKRLLKCQWRNAAVIIRELLAPVPQGGTGA